jgi:hypothetical protein
MSETFDPDLWTMRHMAADELDRFTAILETIEKEQAWFDKFKESVDADPNVVPTEKERGNIMAHIGQLESALHERNAILAKYADQGTAWVELIDYSLAAIESLFDQGKFDLGIIEKDEFWRLVYHRILSDRGTEIGRDPRFRNVKILEVLKDWVSDCLPGFAEHFRERGNPILGQVLEALAHQKSK